MQRICFQMEIIPGREAEYERRHKNVWPDLVGILQASGVSNYSLFRRGQTVTAYAECEPDAATAFALVGQTEVNTRWAAWFEDVLSRLTTEQGDLIIANEVWHLD